MTYRLIIHEQKGNSGYAKKLMVTSYIGALKAATRIIEKLAWTGCHVSVEVQGFNEKVRDYVTLGSLEHEPASGQERG